MVPSRRLGGRIRSKSVEGYLSPPRTRPSVTAGGQLCTYQWKLHLPVEFVKCIFIPFVVPAICSNGVIALGYCVPSNETSGKEALPRTEKYCSTLKHGEVPSNVFMIEALYYIVICNMPNRRPT